MKAQVQSVRLFSRIWVLLWVVMLALGPCAFGQDATGRIAGSVKDSTGAAVAAAAITATNVATAVAYKTTSAADGSYQVLNLPIGHYTLTVQHDGFTTLTTEPNELQINQTVRIDAVLMVGSVQQNVTVNAQAAQIETQVPTVGATVSGETIQTLPLNGRNTLDLALTVPGVVPAPPSNNPYIVSSISIAGGHPDSIFYILDGANNTSVDSTAVVLNPNPDMVAEFRILTSNYTAEFGGAGGGIVSVVTKSGTNTVHGSLYDYFRNDGLDASDYFSNQQARVNDVSNTPRPKLQRNQFGGTFGGPVVIPKLFHGQDKLFFYFGYQGQRESQTQVGPAVTVFTPAEITGDFSHAVNNGPDPNVVAYLQANPWFQPNAGLAAQGIIDPTRINAVSQNYINANLIPSTPSGVEFPHAPATDNRNEYTAKIDYNITPSDHLSGTIGYANMATLVPFGSGSGIPDVVGYPANNSLDTRVLNLAYTKIFSPTLVNEARASVSRYLQDADHPARVLPTTADLGTDIISDLPFGPASLTFASGMVTGFNVEGPTAFNDTVYNYSDTVTKIIGHHTLKAGFTFGANQNNSIYDFGTNAAFYFDGPAGIGSTNDLADFLMGLPDFFYQFPKANTSIRNKEYWPFFQDEWKVTKRLQLTLGLRYEYTGPPADNQGRTWTFVYGLQSKRFVNAPPGLVFPGDPGAPRGIAYPDKNNFAPRLGFAWDPKGDGRTSLRGGFGVFFDDLQGFLIAWRAGTPPLWTGPNLFFSPPAQPITGPVLYLQQPYQSAGLADPFPSTPPQDLPSTLDFGALGYLPYGANQFSTGAHLRTPYIYQYNLSLQHQIGNTLSAELDYIGNSTHKELANADIDPDIVGTDTRVLNTLPGIANGCGAFTCYTNFVETQNLANGNYNGLLASLTKRSGNWHGMGSTFFTASYTWSHMLDNASSWLGSSTEGVPAYDHHLFYGNSDYDVRQRFVLSGGWELPFADLFSNAPRKLTSGWSLYTILSRQSGQPLDVYALAALGISGEPGPSGAGDPQLVRANLAGSTIQFFDPSHVQLVNNLPENLYFNPASFAPSPSNWADPSYIPTAAQRTYGTYRRNSMIGPGFTNLDLSLEKKAPIFGERLQTAFRVEAFNLLNHAEFWTPNTIPTSSLFGQVTSVNPNDPSRIIQLSMRLEF
jgi:hypothetical protein